MDVNHFRVTRADPGCRPRTDRGGKGRQQSAQAKYAHIVDDLFDGVAVIARNDYPKIDCIFQSTAQRLQMGFDAAHVRRIKFSHMQNPQPVESTGRRGLTAGILSPVIEFEVHTALALSSKNISRFWLIQS